jgi:hypothetical protein
MAIAAPHAAQHRTCRQHATCGAHPPLRGLQLSRACAHSWLLPLLAAYASMHGLCMTPPTWQQAAHPNHVRPRTGTLQDLTQLLGAMNASPELKSMLTPTQLEQLAAISGDPSGLQAQTEVHTAVHAPHAHTCHALHTCMQCLRCNSPSCGCAMLLRLPFRHAAVHRGAWPAQLATDCTSQCLEAGALL